MAVNFSLVLGGFIRTLRRPSVRNRLRQPDLPAAPVAVRDPSHHSTTASIDEDGDDIDDYNPDSNDSDQVHSEAATESSDQNSTASPSDLTKPPNSTASFDVPDTIPEANLEHQSSVASSLSAVTSEPDSTVTVSLRQSSLPSPNTAILIAQNIVVSKVPSLLLEPEPTEFSTSTPANTVDHAAPPKREETETPFNSVNDSLIAPRPAADPSVKAISVSENEYLSKHRTVSVGTSSASNRRSLEARNAQPSPSPVPVFDDITVDSSTCEISPEVLEALREQEQMSYDFEADHVSIVHDDDDALPSNHHSHNPADEHGYLSVPATAALTSGHASTYIASPQISQLHSQVSDSGQSLAVCDSLRDMTDASYARDRTVVSDRSEQPHGNIHTTEPMGLSTHHSSDGSNFRSDSEYTENSESRDRISELKQRNDSISAKKFEQIQQQEKERSAAESSKTQSHSITKQPSVSAGRAPSLNRSSSAGTAPKMPSDKPLYRMPSHSIDSEWVLSDRVTYVWDLYDRIRQLGVPGAFGSAHLAREKATGAYRVVKVISKRNRSPAELIGFHKEIEAMKALDHPNVVKFHAAYETRDELHIVMEYCSGGDLFDEIERMLEERGHAKYSERDASRLLKHVLLGLEHMHSKKIAHCDLKPDNFVYENKEAGSPVKIIDFGMARFWNARQRQFFTTHCGTLYYTAPEVIERKYNMACDMWSMGVITYLLLVGYPPFYANPEDYKRMYPDAKEARTALQHDVHAQVLKGFQPVVKRGVGPWFPAERPISASAMNLIARLLDKNVATRLTVLEALEHPWISGTEAPETPLSTMVVRSLKTFDAKRLLQQAAIGIMSDLMSDDDLRIVMRTFKSMDINGDGLVSISDFRIAMSMQKNKMDPAAVEKIFKHTDLDEDGFLCYREILYACIAARLIAKEERLRAAFSKLDVNGDGKISPEEIRTLLEVDKSDATTIIQEVDRDHDGQVDYEEFLAMWRENSLRTPSGF